MKTYTTQGTCSRAIEYEVTDGVLTACRFVGGCPGNTVGVAKLANAVSIAAYECYRQLSLLTYKKSPTINIDLDDDEHLNLTEDERIDVVARRIMKRHKAAFVELAK